MASYGYEGIDKKGARKKGTIEADSVEAALTIVKRMNITPIKVTEQNLLNKDLSIGGGKAPKTKDVAMWCRQYGSLIKAGVTVVDGLNMMADTTENKMLKTASKECSTAVQKGDTLATSMAQYPKCFNSMVISMVDAGEASGSLEKSLDRIAVQLEKSAKTQAAIKKAMSYPMIVGVVAVAALVLLLTWIIPTFTKMLADVGTEMPALTVAVQNISNFMIENWAPLLIGTIIAIVAFLRFKKTEKGQEILGWIILKMPLFGPFTVKSASATLSRTLSTLLSAGLSVTDGLDIVAKQMSNIHFKRGIQEVKDNVLKGVPLNEALQLTGLFPNMVIHMTKIGEDTGEIEGMLEKLADYYEEEVDNSIAGLMGAMEPMIMILLAGVVMLLIGCVFGPMLSMYDGMDNL